MDKLERILAKVMKPARYIGEEVNMVRKDKNSVKVRFAFAFPDTYEVGMSHLGMKILYHLLNERKDVYCERVFAPWVDMEEVMRREGISLYALETKDPIKYFDFVGFTLQYELCYTNIINMLDLAGIPILAKDRDKHPFVIAGGPCAYNPEPLADIFDFFVMGEGEEVINEIIDAYIRWKESKGKRDEFLFEVSKIRGVYVPSFYEVVYNEDGTIKERIPLKKDVPEKISKRIIKNFSNVYFPTKVIIPYIDVVHDRAMLEIFRGCTRGCRFCQAGMIYRPVREKSVEKLMEQAEELIKNTGYEEIALTSLSSSDYSRLGELTKNLIQKYKDRGVGLSLPSLRIDSFTMDIIREIQKVRKTGLTFAPEAGTQRLRDVINKGVTEEDLIKSVESAFKLGWKNVKLYFMIGLPTETYEDIKGIADLAYKVVKSYKDINGSKTGLNVTVSTSSFVPKPFTPFQWVAQDSTEELKAKQDYLKRLLKDKSIKYSWHNNKMSFLEAVISRGDRRVGKAIVKAWELGAKFDSWEEHFDFDKWKKAFSEVNIDPVFYANRARDFEEKLPWDFIDLGVSKNYLYSEYKKALKGELTRDCRLYCTGCGISVFDEGVVCFEGKA